MLNDYVGLAFRDLDLAPLRRLRRLVLRRTRLCRTHIEAEHKAVLQKMLAKEVMPEIGDRAWLRTLRPR